MSVGEGQLMLTKDVQYKMTENTERDLLRCLLAEEEEKNRKLSEEIEQIRQESLKKSEYLSRMSHDIRTPLNVMIGMSTIAKAHKGDSEKVQDCLDKIEMSGKQLLALINEILDISRIESGKFELNPAPFSLQELMKEVIVLTQGMTAIKHQRLEVHLNKLQNANVWGDQVCLQKVLNNLISNAVKYSSERGKILIEVEEFCEEGKDRSIYQFVIKDNGMGMSPELLEHVFDPFIRGKEADYIMGTGLGMTIVKMTIEQMGGTIQIESREGVGSKVTVRVPLEYQKVVQLEDQMTEKKQVRKLNRSINVLLAEDNELNAEIAVDLLEDMGIRVSVVTDGKMAYDAVLRAPRGFYDCVFMDVQMPVMDGLEATEKIRNAGFDSTELPIFAMTANAFTEDVKRTKEAGMQAHICKPLETDSLQRVLFEYFS